MRKRILAILAVQALLLGASAWPESAARESVEQRLTRWEEELPNMVLRHDTEAIRRLMADDFVGYDRAGRRLTQADVMAQTTSTQMEYDFLRHEDIQVRVFGKAAVATAITAVKGRYQGRETGGRFRFTHVWVERRGRWQIVAAQTTTLPNE